MNNIFRYEWTLSLVLSVVILGVSACTTPVDKPPTQPDRITPPPDGPVVQAPVVNPAEETTDQAAIGDPSVPRLKPIAEPVPIEQAPAARRYRIDPSVSDIRIFVYRTGRAARVGHNHVITGEGYEGTLLLTKTVIDSTVDLSIPVKSLLVDDPKAREASGPDFSDQPSEEDRKTTLRNMLSDYILDAENHDAVTLHARVAGGKSPKWQLDADITIRGVTKRVRTPVTLEETRERIVASGTLEIRQSDFGITPFSVLAGALQMKDEVKIQYRLVGRYAE